MLSYQALIGGLLVMMGYPDVVKNGKIMQGTKSFAMILGRVGFVLEGRRVFWLLLI